MFLHLHFKRSLNHHRLIVYIAIILSIVVLTISTSALSSSTASSASTEERAPASIHRAPASVNQAARGHHPHHSTRREIASLRSPHLLKGTQPGIAALPSFPSNAETRSLLLHPQTLEEERHLGYTPEHEDLPQNFHHAPEQLIMGGNLSPALKQDPYYVPPGLLLFQF